MPDLELRRQIAEAVPAAFTPLAVAYARAGWRKCDRCTGMHWVPPGANPLRSCPRCDGREAMRRELAKMSPREQERLSENLYEVPAEELVFGR